MSITPSSFASFDRIVNQRGSAGLFVLGIIILVIGITIGSSLGNLAGSFIVSGVGIILIIASFLFVTKQYERSIILRLGKYSRQVGPALRTRIPFIENVLVVDIREKVREFKAERMLTKDNVPVTIDAILRYKIVEIHAGVEIRHVIIPQELKAAMSMQAKAER